MIRERIGQLVIRAYPSAVRRERGAEMVDTLLDAGDDSRLGFLVGCVSLVRGGLNSRGRYGARVGLVGALGLLGAMVAAAVLLSSGGGLAGSGPRAWMRAQARAFISVSRHDRSCRGATGDMPPAPRMFDGAPPRTLRAHLAVLRRPVPAGARVPAAYVRQLHIAAGGVYIRYARHGAVDGVRYYLLPATHVGGPPLPDHCYASEESDFESETGRYPTPARRKALRWEHRLIAEDSGNRLGIVLVLVNGRARSVSYITADRLLSGRWSAGGGGNDRITMTATVLPNSIASVTAHYSAQTRPGRVPRPLTTTHRVSDNLVVFVFRGAWDPPKLTYHSVSGAVVTPKSGDPA